ncbi:citrate-binding protein-like [Heracleum sosnowskyi]|uniref:Citrate-binding protein-like n=1 Tax=Heracleum sosnowskyi TaxID=360622 RepID=A0AAD8HRI4_9APIA|nr:citrate-binding protein-like [Heracleum sosnowskyi]
MKTSCNHYSSLLLIFVSITTNLYQFCYADPTDGFTLLPLTDHNIKLQKPYNEPLDDRYSYDDGVRRLWVYTNDKPFQKGSGTRPRTEVRIKGYDYSSGIWQFEGHAYVPKGTSGVTIMQIHGARQGATTLQLRIYNGDLKYYKFDVIEKNLYDKWFRVNVIHNVDEGELTVFINGVKKYVKNDQGPGDLYFKCGVYAAPAGSSNYMESRWKGIKIYKK